METSSYPGDKAAAEILHRADYHYTVAGLKALMAGVLLGRSFVHPSVVLDHIEFGAIDQPHFGDKELAKDFLGVFFSLWNEIANHRNGDNPFSFSQSNSSWKTDDVGTWLKFAESREMELGEFLVGLGISDTPTLVDLREGGDVDSANYLPMLLAKHLGDLEKESRKIQKKKSQDTSSIRHIITAIDSDLKKYHRAFLEKMMSIQVDSNPSKSAVREGPKIGRNDPCPCGSGKKFKQCCLQ